MFRRTLASFSSSKSHFFHAYPVLTDIEMKMLEEVASLNRMAVTFLQFDRHQDAIACFHKAMNYVQENCVADFEADVQKVFDAANK